MLVQPWGLLLLPLLMIAQLPHAALLLLNYEVQQCSILDDHTAISVDIHYIKNLQNNFHAAACWQ
jgi:hypothetical protein